MNNKKIKDILKNYENLEAPDSIIDKTVQLAKQEFEKTPIRYKMPFRELFIGQIKYISPYIWFVQAIFLLFIVFSVALSTHGINDHQTIMTILSVSAPIIALVAIPELAKSFSHNMWEIESTSKFNLQKLIAIRLMILGVFNLLIITGLVVFTSTFYEINFVNAVLYLFVPYNFTNSIYLFLLRKHRGKRVVIGCLITGLMIASALGILSTLNFWYVLTSTFIWIVLLAFSIGSLVYELIKLFKGLRSGGEMLWNYQ
ncbi:hypothetical protein SSIL_2330 [Solibacillus silvestris StLB046]|uniref:Uncharacterized protein n=1 Tax=Solibacillus silvestris (strain StLB046) TaxID=1002809 RepID=F2FAI6_SOLSS|nr:hypothetical protein [Solibacillus silvestris]BAK16753.1 hypothetical protein SSIL_2330 [Solibacillus silvestris StLB046]